MSLLILKQFDNINISFFVKKFANKKLFYIIPMYPKYGLRK